MKEDPLIFLSLVLVNHLDTITPLISQILSKDDRGQRLQINMAP